MSAYFEPGVLLSDEELADRVRLRHWTITEAFFWLQGQRSPGIEHSEGLRAWYPSAYNDAVRAIEVGDLGQEKTRAGERAFIDRPANWLAWADSLEPEDLSVDVRVRRLLSSGDDNQADQEREKARKWREHVENQTDEQYWIRQEELKRQQEEVMQAHNKARLEEKKQREAIQERERAERKAAAQLEKPSDKTPNQLDTQARSKGGRKRKYARGFQKFVDDVREQLVNQDKRLTLGTLEVWLQNNALPDEPYESGIDDCDLVYFEDNIISWTDKTGKSRHLKLRSLDPYIKRSKTPRPALPSS